MIFRKSMFFAMILCFMSVSFATIPKTFNYQGKLVDGFGVAINGEHDVMFEIFAAASGGTALWTETHEDVMLEHGLFAVILGSITPLTVDFSSGAYVQITVDGATLVPRMALSSVPMAMRAAIADSVAGGSSNTWLITGTDMTSVPTGNVGIGITPPLYKLHVVASDDDAVAKFTNTSGLNAAAVRAEANATDNFGVGIIATGGKVGSIGTVQPVGEGEYTGMRGEVSGGSGINYGVVGIGQYGGDDNYGGHFTAKSGTNAIALYATATEGINNWAAYFAAGDVNISEDLYVLGGIHDGTSFGTLGQVLTSTGTGVEWVSGGAGTDNDWAYSSGSDLTGDIYHMGNVAIGVNPAIEKLHVRGGSARFEHAADSAMIKLFRSAPDYLTSWKGFGIGVEASASAVGQFFIGDYGTNTGGLMSKRIVIGNAGNVGIGTETPLRKLHVGGDLQVEGKFFDSFADSGEYGDALISSGMGTMWSPSAWLRGADFAYTAGSESEVTRVVIEDDGDMKIRGGGLVIGNMAGVLLEVITWTDSTREIPDGGCPGGDCASDGYADISRSLSGIVGTISDVEVMVSIEHTYDYDLSIWLVSPEGTIICLSSHNGDWDDNYTHTRFSDDATISIVYGLAPFTGTYLPETALELLEGQNPNGTWSLRVCDATGGEVGGITEFRLFLRVSDLDPGVGDALVSGKLGVGTAAPTHKLTVSGNAKITGALTTSGITYPTADGTAGQVLSTRGDGTTQWIDAGLGVRTRTVVLSPAYPGVVPVNCNPTYGNVVFTLGTEELPPYENFYQVEAMTGYSDQEYCVNVCYHPGLPFSRLVRIDINYQTSDWTVLNASVCVLVEDQDGNMVAQGDHHANMLWSIYPWNTIGGTDYSQLSSGEKLFFRILLRSDSGGRFARVGDITLVFEE